jgi:hypothetical protein
MLSPALKKIYSKQKLSNTLNNTIRNSTIGELM